MDTTPAPLVSVIIPTCNRPDSLALALDSLCWQTFKNFEAVIVDDGQIDPLPVIQQYASRLRISYLKNPKNLGVAATRNAGLRAAAGRYMAYLDDDDLYYENHLEFLATMLQEGGVSFAYTDGNQALLREIDGKWTIVNRRVNHSREFNAQELLHGNYIPTLCIMHDRRCLEVAGYFKTHLGAHEDWDLWLRMSRYYSFAHVPHPTCEYMVRAGGNSLSGDEESMKETWLYVRKLAGLLERLPRVEDLAANLRQAQLLRQSDNPECRLSIVLYADKNSAHILPASLAALNNACPPNAELVLLLDEQTDLAEKMSQTPKNNITIISYPQPVGRTLALNHALRHVRGEILLFASPELRPRPGGMEAMLELLKNHNNRAIVTAPLTKSSGAAYLGGVVRPDGRIELLPASEGRSAPDCASLHCLMLTKELIATLGGFAPRFAPAYYEDADLCLRARRDHHIPTVALAAPAFGLEKNKSLATSELVLQKAQASHNTANFAAQWGEEPDLVVLESGNWL